MRQGPRSGPFSRSAPMAGCCANIVAGFSTDIDNYVVIPLINGRLKLITEGGAENFADLKAGQPYFRNVGVEHDVINDGDGEYAFIEIEIK